jgi:hypothetical protein
VPIHQAYRKEVGEQFRLQFHISEIVVIVRKIGRIDLLKGRIGDAPEIIVTVVKLPFPDLARRFRITKDPANSIP